MPHRTFPADRDLQRVVNRLFSSAVTPGDVAAKLRRMGIRGARGECHRCPIAVVLTRETGRYVEVGFAFAEFYQDKGRPDWGVCLPNAVREFINAFDNPQDCPLDLRDLAIDGDVFTSY